MRKLNAFSRCVYLKKNLKILLVKRNLIKTNRLSKKSRPKGFHMKFQIKPTSLNYREVENGLLKGQLHVSLMLRSEHFTKGPPVLKCTANILDLYSQFAELPLKSRRGPPTLGRGIYCVI